MEGSGVPWGHLEGRSPVQCRAMEVPLFLGTFYPRLDDKGRLIVPAKYRAGLAGGLVIAKGQENCLNVFPMAEFVALTDKLRTASFTDEASRVYQRILFSSAHDCEPDSQHRVSIPTDLRLYAGLDRDLAVLGSNNRLEIWDSTAWATWQERADPIFSATASEVVPGVL